MGKYADLFEEAPPVTTSGKYADLFDSGAPEPQATPKSVKYSDLFDEAPAAPGLDLAGENQVRAKLGYSQLPPEGSPEYQAELDKASGGHVTDSQAMQSLEQDIINRRSSSPEWLQPIEHALKANLVPIGAHPEKLVEGAVPVVEAYQDVKRLVTDPKSFLGPTATSGKFSPVDLGQQQNLDELVGHVLGGAPAVHGVRTGLAARKGTVEAPTAPPERPSEPAAPETPPVAEAAPNPAPIGITETLAELTRRNAPEQPLPSTSFDQSSMMINAVKTPTGKIIGHGVEHGDVISRLSEQYDPKELTSGWVLKRPTKAETDATFIGTDDVQKTNGDFEAAFRAKGAFPFKETPLQQAPKPANVPVADELSTSQAQAGQRDSAPREQPAPPAVDRGSPQESAGGGQDSIGVAERYVEEQQPGTAVPGTRENAAHWRAKGAEYINAGGDPRMPIRAAGAGHTSPRNVGIVSAEYARLEQLRRNAGAALEERPNDPALQKQYDETAQATQAWRREMQPVLTKAGESLAAIQGEMPVDLSTFDGLHAKAMELNGGHPLTPGQKAQLMKRAGTAKKIKAYETDAVARRDAVIDKTLPKVKAPTEADMAAMVDKMVKRMTPCR